MRISCVLGLASALVQAGWVTLGAAAAPIETSGPSLTTETWAQVEKGTWLVEHYSPYCPHCKSFAPTWKKMVEAREVDAGGRNFHFGQVDCASNGDLCTANGVKYYPSIFLYVNGEQFDEYDGKRDLEHLNAYIDENMPDTVEWEDDETEKLLQAQEKAAEEAEEAQVAQEEQEDEREAEQLAKAEAGEIDDDEVEIEFGRHAAAKEDLDRIAADEQQKQEDSFKLDGDGTGARKNAAEQEKVRQDEQRMIVQVQVPADREAHTRSQEVNPPDGLVHTAGIAEINALKAEDGPAGFVKYFAPWCGHCKTLAPRWTELAVQLKGQVHFYEVDCDDSKNTRVCRQEKVKAYPTLVFYVNGQSVEYSGKRDVETMKLFALKAQSATQIKPIANEFELKRAAAQDEVIFLFLHPPSGATSEEDMSLASSTAKSLLGGAPFYTSSSSDLFTLYGLPSAPYLLAFHDHQSTYPASVFALPPSTLSKAARLAGTQEWLALAKLPTLSEISASTYADIMREKGNPPLVGVVVLSRKMMGSKFDEYLRRTRDLAEGWAERRRGQRKEEQGREVVWAWVDGDKWAGWIKQMYSTRATEEPLLIIADTKELKFWKTSLENEPLSIDKQPAYNFIEQGIYSAIAPYETSKSLADRIADSFGRMVGDLTRNPFMTLLGVAAGWLLLAGLYRSYMRRQARQSLLHPRGYAKLD